MVSVALPSADIGYSSAPSADSDAELMLAARNCARTFTTLVSRYRKPLLSYFQRHGVHSDGDDLVQETFLRLHRYRDRYQPSARFSSFLFTLANHAWLDHGRRTMRRERAYTAFEETLRDEPGTSADLDHGIDLETAVNQLPSIHLEVIQLYYYGELTLNEIAGVLNVPPGTVKSRLNHALSKLREIVSRLS